MSSRGSYGSGYYSNGAFFLNKNTPIISNGNNQRDYQKSTTIYSEPFGSNTGSLYRSYHGTYINTCNGSYKYVGPKLRNQQNQV